MELWITCLFHLFSHFISKILNLFLYPLTHFITEKLFNLYAGAVAIQKFLHSFFFILNKGLFRQTNFAVIFFHLAL